VVAVVSFATAMMFRHTGIEEARWGSSSFFEVLWSCSGDRRGIGAAGCRRFLGEADRAGLVRYADSFANHRVLLLTG
jgi:hypothetical protein